MSVSETPAVVRPESGDVGPTMRPRRFVHALFIDPSSRRVEESILAILAAFALGAVALVASGINPGDAYTALLQGAAGSVQSLANTAVQTGPLLLASLAVGISFRAGVFNIGAGGQLGMGALTAAIIGGYVHLGPGLELIAMAVGAMVVGALYAGIAGVLKAYAGANVVVVTLMLTYVAADVIDYAVTGPAKAPGVINQTPQLSGAAMFPTLVSNTQLTLALPIALAIVPLVWFLLFRTGYGFRLRMVGLNPNASTAAGFSVKRVEVSVLAWSGALAGLAGMIEVAGVLGSVPQEMSLQVGYTAIVVALLGNNSPMGILLASVFIGGLTAGSTTMEAQANVSGSFAVFLEAVMIVGVVAVPMTLRFLKKRRPAVVVANVTEPQ